MNGLGRPDVNVLPGQEIAEVVAGFRDTEQPGFVKGESPPQIGGFQPPYLSVAAITLTIQGEPGPWGSPPSTVPMRSPETEQTVAVASGRTKFAWPDPAFVVFVSRPSSP